MDKSVTTPAMLPFEDPEEWRPAIGYEGRYEVSSLGRVYSVRRPRVRSGVIMKPTVHPYGYLYVSLYDAAGKHKRHTVHSLVAAAFIGPRPDGMEVLHGPNGQTDNRASQLRYGTHGDNMQDALRDGTHHHANVTHCPALHEYTEANTYVMPNGGRVCRQCKRDKYRAAAAAKPRKVLAKELPCTHGDCEELQTAKGLCPLHYARQRARLPLDVPVAPCLRCGEPFDRGPDPRSCNRKYCSDECARLAHCAQVTARKRAIRAASVNSNAIGQSDRAWTKSA